MNSQLPFQKYSIDGACPGPYLLITAGVHGDEFEGMAALRRLISHVDRAGLQGRLTLIPVVNESAFSRGQRVAEDGLDLARVCPGRPDGSITERVADALSRLIRTADFYIDLHSGGAAMSVMPLAGYGLHADAKILDQQRRMARAFNLPLVWGTTPNLQGRTLSVARDAGVPAIYTEYLGSGVCNEQGVRDYFCGCLNVMGELGMIVHSAPTSKIEYVVEDARPESGHLQICNPAPHAGFFEPAASLGQRVAVGDLLGSITNALGTEVHRVHALQTGILVCLNTFSRVREGQSLAVIVEA